MFLFLFLFLACKGLGRGFQFPSNLLLLRQVERFGIHSKERLFDAGNADALPLTFNTLDAVVSRLERLRDLVRRHAVDENSLRSLVVGAVASLN